MSEAVEQDTTRIPVIEEQVEAGTRKVVTGGVRVHKTVQERQETIDQPLYKEEVDVRRVVRNEPVDGPLPVRNEGDTVVVPLVKEVIDVRKSYVLTEELHITRRRTVERHEQPVTLRNEEATVERIDADRNPVGPAEVLEPEPARVEEPAPVVAEKTRKGVRLPQLLDDAPAPRPERRNKILRD